MDSLNDILLMINQKFNQKIDEELLEKPEGEIISVQKLCDLVKSGKVSVGDKFLVDRFQTKFGEVITSEIIYDIFENEWVDSMIYGIGKMNPTKNGNILRYRYFSEGYRSRLPIVNPTKLRDDHLLLFNSAMEASQNA